MSANHSLQKLLDELGRLPGIGPKSAQRIAYHLLEADAEEARRLAEAILEVKQEVHFCSRCFNYATADECSICQDSMRDTTRICVVGEPRDVQAIERTGSYHGLYHVLGGVISPMDKIGPEQLHIRELLVRLGHEDIHEVIIATLPAPSSLWASRCRVWRAACPWAATWSMLTSLRSAVLSKPVVRSRRRQLRGMSRRPAARGAHNWARVHAFVVQQTCFSSAYRVDGSTRTSYLPIRCTTFWVR